MPIHLPPISRRNFLRGSLAAAAGVDAKLELRLMQAGADAVVDKSLGPELVSQAADAALDRKRLGAR